MALEKAITTEHGIELPKAYIRIDSIQGDKTVMYATVSIYKDDNAAIDKIPISSTIQNCTVDTSGNAVNYHKQIYEHLKTLTEFADAIDC